MRLSKLFLLVILLSAPSGIEILAQTNSLYQVANRLFQQQRYEEALPILTSIHRQGLSRSPGSSSLPGEGWG